MESSLLWLLFPLVSLPGLGSMAVPPLYSNFRTLKTTGNL